MYTKSVAVESNEMKPLNSTLALGFYPWVSTEGRAKWLFLFLYSIPQGGIANGLHGLNPRNTAHSTPLCKMRPALVWRPVISQVHGGTRLVDKVNKLVIRTWDSLIYQSVWSGSDTSVSTLGRTIVKSKAKEREYV